MQIPSAESSANMIIKTIHEIAEDHVPMGAQLGLVLSVDPLQIAVNNIVLTEKNLYIDQFLLMGYQRETSGTTTLSNVSGNLSLDSVSGTMTANLIE